jgi:multimeric flavodoxin WrbA
MDVIGVVGSPRKGGNTDLLVDAVLGGARDRGHRVSKIHLHDHEIGPCVDCRGCKQGARVCVVEDGMREVYARLDAADVIVLGTPVYWCGPSGPMKQMLDRWRPYFSNGRMKGKRAVLVAVAKDGPGEADLLVGMFRRALGYLDVELAGCALGTAYDRGEILDDHPTLERAAALGAAL